MKWEDAKHGHIITVCDRIADNATVLAGRAKWYSAMPEEWAQERVCALKDEIVAGAAITEYLMGGITDSQIRGVGDQLVSGAMQRALLSIVEPYTKPWHDDVGSGRASVYDAAWRHVAKALREEG